MLTTTVMTEEDTRQTIKTIFCSWYKVRPHIHTYHFQLSILYCLSTYLSFFISCYPEVAISSIYIEITLALFFYIVPISHQCSASWCLTLHRAISLPYKSSLSPSLPPSPPSCLGGWYLMIVCGQAAHIWVCRTTTVSIFQHGIFTNRVTNYGVVIALLLGCFVTYLPGKRRSIEMISLENRVYVIYHVHPILDIYYNTPYEYRIFTSHLYNASPCHLILTPLAPPFHLHFHLHYHLHLICSLT